MNTFPKQLLFLASLTLIIMLSIACGGGSAGGLTSSSSSLQDEPADNTIDISSMPLVTNVNPSIGTKTTLSIQSHEDLMTLNWEVISQPDNSNLQLIQSSDNKSIDFEVAEPGEYSIQAALGLSSSAFTFTVYPEEGSIVNPVNISSLPFLSNVTPSIGKQTTLSIQSNEDLMALNWEVISQPDNSNLQLLQSSDNKSIDFTVAQPGEYSIQATLGLSSSAFTFTVYPEFEFDEAYLQGNVMTGSLSKSSGIITNQAWVYSKELGQSSIKTIIDSFSEFEFLGHDPIEGSLIQFDSSDLTVSENLEILKFIDGIDSVTPRSYYGDDVDKSYYLPNDNSSFFDGGENWHLEEGIGINAVDAWDSTRGSTNILVGVTDAGYYKEHEELAGRYSHILTGVEHSHGTGVAGTIGANTNNQLGISGINHVSPMVLSWWGRNDYLLALQQRNSNGDKAVKVINNSWGPFKSTVDYAIYFTRPYRNISNTFSDVLHVWAAGNDGADARFLNGALHLNKIGELDKSSNIIVVAAVGSDGRLVSYSNYGVAVDIAAPTEFLGIRGISPIDGTSTYYSGFNYGSAFSGGFNGTSAAAPVVTGVASLIFSLSPSFSADDVKDILIESANEFITERYTNYPPSVTQALEHPIPLINAEAAIDHAQAIINGKVRAKQNLTNSILASGYIKFESIDSNLEVTDITFEHLVSDDGGANWFTKTTGIGVDGAISYSIEQGTYKNRVDSIITLTDPKTGMSTTAYSTDDILYTKLIINVKDTVTLNPLPRATVSLSNPSAETNNGVSDENGRLEVYLDEGTYKISAALSGYEEGAVFFTSSGNEELQTDLFMTPETLLVGSVKGTVWNMEGLPIGGASVRISGGNQTNGFFATAVTNSLGDYIISNISKKDSEGNSILAYAMEASALGYYPMVLEDVIVLEGKQRTVGFSLTVEDRESETIFFEDNFETISSSWSANGLWHIEDFSGGDLSNTLVDDGFVSLAPDESESAFLPTAISGNSAWWYGDNVTGSFVGDQITADSNLSGGTSASSNFGHLTSPAISLAHSQSPILKFQTWWEIESVNPNENGFDIMEIQISIDAGLTFQTIKKLNPFIDPNDVNRDSKPFSSGGYNRKPQWALEELDLSDYSDEEIMIRYSFSTNDGLFNGFRGWIIDDLRIVEDQPITLSKPSYKSKNEQMNSVSDEFLNVHKRPKTYSKEMPLR